MNKNKKVSILGLGYVGLTLGLVLAKNGIKVFGYDTNKKIINKLRSKNSTIFEKNIEKYINKYVNKSLIISSKILISDIYIITVGTPLKNKKKVPDINILSKSIFQISNLIKKNDLIILRSTVPIGTTRKLVIPIIEKNSNLKVGKDFKISFCPERTVEGNALKELETIPQIIGGYDNKSYTESKNLFLSNTKKIINANSLEAAEMCKLLDNTFRDTVFAYSNQMAKLSEKLNLNLSELIQIVNTDYKRNSIPRPSPGVGGPCLSKDPYILDNVFKKNNLESKIILNSRKINESMIFHIYNRCKKLLLKKKKKLNKSKIFISGIAFKGSPPTADTRFSTSIDLINTFKNKNIKNIFCHDFEVSKSNLADLNLNYLSLEKGFRNSDIVIIMNEHHFYKKLKIKNLVNLMNDNSILFDTWGVFSKVKFNNKDKNIDYIGIGF